MRFAIATALLATGTSQAQVVPAFPGNDHSYGISASRDLRYVAFTSNASNLVPGDTNGQPDVFVADRQTGAVVRASVDVDGIQGNGPSAWPSISADGRYVAFDTGASNLANGARLVRKDLQTGAVASGGVTGGYSPAYPSLSDDGRYAASDPFGVIQLHDFDTGTKTDVTTGGFFEDAHPVISGDGRYVFFASNRDTLVPAGPLQAYSHIFRWDRTNPNAGVARVSLGAGGVDANGASPPFGLTTRPTRSPRPLAVSFDGNLIAFASNATNLDAAGSAGLFLRNISTGAIARLATCDFCQPFPGTFEAVEITGDGTRVAFHASASFLEGAAPRTAGYYRVASTGTGLIALGERGPEAVVFDSPYSMAIANDGASFALQTTLLVGGGVDDRARYGDVFAAAVGGPLSLVSRGSRGRAGDGHSRQPALSDDGRVVAFSSDAANLVAGDTNARRDVYVRDYTAGTTIIASNGTGGVAADGPSSEPSLSGDGKVVAFFSNANNLVAGDTGGADIFVRVLATGTLERISAGTSNVQGASALSFDGRYVAYSAGDVLYLYDRDFDTPIVASPTIGNQPPNESCNFCETFPLSMSDDGRYVAFNARATNYVAGQNAARDVFVFDRDTNMVELINRGDGANGPEGTGDSFAPTISGDGRYVAWYASSGAGMLPGAPPGTTIFLRDRVASTTQAVGKALHNSNFSGTQPRPTVSRDGSTVAFVSESSSVVAGDSNRLADLFLWDRATATSTRASLTSAWSQADGASYVFDLSVQGFPRFFAVALSRDASIFAYASAATNLGLRDDNAADDIFITRADSRAVARVSDSVPPPGDLDRSAPAATADGSVAVMVGTDRSGALGSSAPGARAKGGFNKWASVIAYDFGTGEEQQLDVSSTGVPANEDSFYPSIAPGGGVAAFTSNATNLGSALDGNGRPDVFVRDVPTGTTVSITAGADGNSGRSATVDIGGKWQTTFESNAGNLPGAASANAVQDVFVAREGAVENTFTITPISVALVGGTPNGPSSNPSMAPNGRFAAFASLATNLVASDANAVSDIFVRDLATSTTAQVSIGAGGVAPNGPSGQPAIVAPGIGDKWVAAFESDASNVTSGDTNNDTDVFVRVSDSLAPEKVSNGMNGLPANGKSLNPAISIDGRYVAFVSTASNLVPLDLNNAPDVFLYDRVTDETTLVSKSGVQQANDFSLQPSVSLNPGGRPIVTWDSAADNLIPGDDDDAIDVFQLDTGTGGLDSTSGVIFLDGFE